MYSRLGIAKRLAAVEAATKVEGPPIVECDGAQYGLPPTDGGWFVALDKNGHVLKAWPAWMWHAR